MALTHSAASVRAPATRSCELHLLAEMVGERGPHHLRPLVPAAGVSYLVPGRTPAALTRRKPRGAALSLEPVLAGGARRLLVLVPNGLDVRWNALPAPPVLLLRVGDELRVPGGPLLHLTERVSAEGGAPRPEHVGRPCGVCHVPIARETSVLCCRSCGLPMHLEGEPLPADRRLECASFAGECPSCDAAVAAGSEYVWLPEGLGGLRA